MRISRVQVWSLLAAGLLSLACLLSAFPGKSARADDPPPPTTPPPPLATSGVSGDQVLFVFIVNTAERKILVYRTETPGGGHVMLCAYRDYSYDLTLDEWPPLRARDRSLSTDGIRDLIERSEEFKKDKADKKVKDVEQWVKERLKDAKGQTSLVTEKNVSESDSEVLQGSVYRSGFFYLVDKANKKILVYELSGNKLSFVSTRKWEYDVRLPDSKDLDKFVPYEEVKKAVLKMEKERKEKQAREAGEKH